MPRPYQRAPVKLRNTTRCETVPEFFLPRCFSLVTDGCSGVSLFRTLSPHPIHRPSLLCCTLACRSGRPTPATCTTSTSPSTPSTPKSTGVCRRWADSCRVCLMRGDFRYLGRRTPWLSQGRWRFPPIVCQNTRSIVFEAFAYRHLTQLITAQTRPSMVVFSWCVCGLCVFFGAPSYLRLRVCRTGALWRCYPPHCCTLIFSLPTVVTSDCLVCVECVLRTTLSITRPGCVPGVRRQVLRRVQSKVSQV